MNVNFCKFRGTVSCGQIALNRAGIKYDNYYAGSVLIWKCLPKENLGTGTPPDNSPRVIFRFWRFGRIYGDYRDHLPFHIRFSSRYLLSLWPDLFLLRRFLVWSKSQGEPKSSVPLLQWSQQTLGTPTYLALQFDRLLLCIPFLALVWCRCGRETAIGLWRSYYGDLVFFGGRGKTTMEGQT